MILERLTVIEETSEIVSINKRIALENAKCYMELVEKAKLEKPRAPSLFDAITLATARALNAKLITGDEHFKGNGRDNMDRIIDIVYCLMSPKCSLSFVRRRRDWVCCFP